MRVNYNNTFYVQLSAEDIERLQNGYAVNSNIHSSFTKIHNSKLFYVQANTEQQVPYALAMDAEGFANSTAFHLTVSPEALKSIADEKKPLLQSVGEHKTVISVTRSLEELV